MSVTRRPGIGGTGTALPYACVRTMMLALTIEQIALKSGYLVLSILVRSEYILNEFVNCPEYWGYIKTLGEKNTAAFNGILLKQFISASLEVERRA